MTEPRWERVEGWGRSTWSVSRVARPTSLGGAQGALEQARERGWTVGLRGSGCSYGDASQNDGGLLLDLTAWNHLHSFDPETGIAVVDPGVTIEQLWKATVPHGWWPKVVSGTMAPTIGGAAAMNIHGKNAWKAGTIGDAIRAFELLLPDGTTVRCTREQNADLFFGAISGFGSLGLMHRIELQNHFVGSGRLIEHPYSYPDLDGMFEGFEQLTPHADYCVGWIDAFAAGRRLGRGQIHTANYLSEGQDPRGTRMRDPRDQALPDRLFGVFPKRHMWRFLVPFARPLGMRLLNVAKFVAGELPGAGRPYHQTHAGYHFLLDYVPDFKRMYGRGGLIQFQPFVPREAARDVFRRLLTMQQERGIVNWLTVLKRHRPDPFLLTHGLDGYSLAMDFQVTDAGRGDLWRLCQDMADVVLDAGGRFYPAKDATLTASQFRRAMGQDALSRFEALRQRVDPERLLRTNLTRRLLGDP